MRWKKCRTRNGRAACRLCWSQEEAIALINSAKNLYHRAMLEIAVFVTGTRRAELCQLKVEDIDSHRIVIHIRQGKGGKEDRDVPLSANLLETLRARLALDAASRSICFPAR